MRARAATSSPWPPPATQNTPTYDARERARALLLAFSAHAFGLAGPWCAVHFVAALLGVKFGRDRAQAIGRRAIGHATAATALGAVASAVPIRRTRIGSLRELAGKACADVGAAPVVLRLGRRRRRVRGRYRRGRLRLEVHGRGWRTRLARRRGRRRTRAPARFGGARAHHQHHPHQRARAPDPHRDQDSTKPRGRHRFAENGRRARKNALVGIVGTLGESCVTSTNSRS